MSEGKPKTRCAIYTRKSSEEGLEQEFNSLDAQYDACAFLHRLSKARRMEAPQSAAMMMVVSQEARWSALGYSGS
jgi:hypothetical protein